MLDLVVGPDAVGAPAFPVVITDAPAVGVPVVGMPGQNPAPPPGQGEEFGKASPVALVVILALALVTVLLIVSMTRRIRRLPASFEPTGTTPEAPTERDGATEDTPDPTTDTGTGAPMPDGTDRVGRTPD